MAKKRKIIYQEWAVKGVRLDKTEVINLINNPTVDIFLNRVAKYDDGKELVAITIDNISNEPKK